MTIERNLAEMAQGKLVQQRAERLAQLETWVREQKIVLRYMLDGDRWQVWLYEWPGPSRRGTLLAEEKDSNAYPSEAFVAKVALGIEALGSNPHLNGARHDLECI